MAFLFYRRMIHANYSIMRKPALVLLMLLALTCAKAQRLIGCPYKVVNYSDRSVCFDYEVRSSKITGIPCDVLFKGKACLPRPENNQPNSWQLDSTYCRDAEDIVITVKTCGGCTLNPKLTCSGGCEGGKEDSGHTPCCRSFRVTWGASETAID